MFDWLAEIYDSGPRIPPKPKIASMIPASGWTAWSAARGGVLLPHDVIAWAVVIHDGGHEEVEGLVVSGSVIRRVGELGGDTVMYLPSDVPLDHA